MKRYRRWIFNGMAALSLVVFVTTLAFWPASYRFKTYLNDGRYKPQYGFGFDHGRVGVALRVQLAPLPNPTLQMPLYPRPAQYAWMGFLIVSGEDADYDPYSSIDHYRIEVIVVPCWLVIILSSIIPVIWIALWRREKLNLRKHLSGFCLACGYDLRATPDRCPECGKIPVDPKIIST